MTDNEAVKELKEAIDCCTSGEEEYFKEALGMGILAIEEIQQYRAIGTVERLKFLKEVCDLNGDELEHLANAVIERRKYANIGTIEEFKALKEKNEPKKIDIWANGEEHCPFCDKNLTTFYGFANCFSCGQKLDWQ